MKTGYASSVLEEIIVNIQTTKLLGKDQIRVLYNLVGNLLIEALQILDDDSVTRLNSGTKNGRHIYKVVNNQQTHLCFLTPRHCSCDSFLKTVVIEASSLLCPHVLAVILFHALDHQQIKVLEEELFAELLYTWDPAKT